jgi:alkanesulfonate monooxygenase SsuD/methylene tetrahydromethanopterin reductase-like flavin-dependent oxidoreductase (luciferase family)
MLSGSAWRMSFLRQSSLTRRASRSSELVSITADYAISAPTVVLGALAMATKNIRLTTAVTILSSSDPVRIFEEFATVDLLSGGRAELIVGRGAFTESFPLFGYDLDDYDALYIEKLDLLRQALHSERITWQGRFRPALHDAEVAPRPLSPRPPIWIGAGGTPASAVRAGKAGLPLNLANISREPARFKPFIDLYRRSGVEAGHDPADLKVGISSHLHVQKHSQAALDEFYPYYARYIGHNLPNRDRGAQISRRDYDLLAGPRGALFVGSPQQITDKILYEHEMFGHQRFMAQTDIGGLPFAKISNVIELLASEVLPVVQRAIGKTEGQN